MKQETLEDKKFQQKLVDKLNNGELSYQHAPIYTILLDLVQGNSADEVYRVFCEVIKEQNKKLYSEEDMRLAINKARDISDGKDCFDAEDISGCTEVCTYGWKFNMSEDSIIEQFKKK